MLKVSNIAVSLDEKDYAKVIANTLNIRKSQVKNVKIARKAVDARRKNKVHFNMGFTFECANEDQLLKTHSKQVSKVKEYHYDKLTPNNQTIMVVGSGPAGLFCAYNLARSGQKVILIEQGKCVDERKKDIDTYLETGKLNVQSNVQFGEGGAGTFSDGKLTTGIKDYRKQFVLNTFYEHGANEDILYLNKPHLGTDVLINVVKNIRNRIIAGGGEVHFRTEVTKILEENGRVTGVMTADGAVIETDHVILSVGHSARDLFAELDRMKVFMEPKPFAVGLRIQHPQAQINKNQYGMEDAGKLGAAPYKVTAKTTSGRGVYSFCMCPGGMVVNASSEKGHLAVNGMSNFKRDSGIANSALIVAITPADFPEAGPLGGIAFQRSLEERAFALGGGKIPIQLYGDFAANRPTVALGDVDPVFCGGFSFANLRELMPEALNGAFLEGMEQFGRRIKGFDRADAVLAGIESRTSSPLRICRDESLQSSLKGLYPCGEGAGYAGGITSAAMDGLKVAEEIIKRYAAAE